MKKKLNQPLIVILGPTSSGKTKMATRLALKFGGEIVSADSRQVYRGLDLGSGKDLAEYNINGTNIPYHLIDIASPKRNFCVFRYQKKAFGSLHGIIKRGKLPFLVGGSGLYLKAVIEATPLSSAGPNIELRRRLARIGQEEKIDLLKKINPTLPASFDWQNPRRVSRAIEKAQTPDSLTKIVTYPQYNSLVLGIKRPIAEVRERINQRLQERLKEGLVDEVKKLLALGVSHKRLRSLGLECRYLSYYLTKEMNYDEAVLRLGFAIGRFAKKQLTWFKKTPGIVWIKNQAEAEILIKKHLDNISSANKNAGTK